MSTRTSLSDRELRHIEDSCAAGLSLEEIAADFGVSIKQFKVFQERDPRVNQALDRGARKFEVISDTERRRRLKKEELKFIPAPADLELIQELATYGWGQFKIADEFQLSPKNWLLAKKKFASLAEALKMGYAQSGGHRLQVTIDSWMPRPADLKVIQDLAYKGLTLKSISVRMHLPTETLGRKAQEIPEIFEAYNFGRGLYMSELEEIQAERAKEGNFQERFFQLKTQDKHNWSERPPTAGEIKLEGRPGRGKRLVVPLPLGKKEQEREATKHRKEHLKIVRDQKAADS